MVAVAAVEVVAATLQAIGAGLTACGPGALIHMAISQHTSRGAWSRPKLVRLGYSPQPSGYALEE